MSTESEVKLARYTQVEREVDDMGRLIGVRRLKPSEQLKISGFTPELVGFEEVLDEEGRKNQVSHRLPLMIAASVCEIDRHPIPFPKTRGELDAIFDRLDAEGLAAASRGIATLQATSGDPESPVDEAKNLPRTPLSE